VRKNLIDNTFIGSAGIIPEIDELMFVKYLIRTA